MRLPIEEVAALPFRAGLPRDFSDDFYLVGGAPHKH